MGLQRQCTRCTAGTETCVVGSFFTCNVCDRTENEVDEAFVESDAETTLDEDDFGGYSGGYVAADADTTLQVWDVVSSLCTGGLTLATCEKCGCVGAIENDPFTLCPGTACLNFGGWRLAIKNYELIPIFNHAGEPCWRRVR